MDKGFILKYEKILSSIYRALFNGGGYRRGHRNRVDYGNSFCRKMRFDMSGVNNEICFAGGLSRFNNCHFSIHGSNNSIIFHNHVRINGCTFCIEDDDNVIEVFDDTWINPFTEFAALEGTKIIVGKRCMFSSRVSIRTSDSHSVLDAGLGLRINPAKSIEIGNHVWVGEGVTILKGSIIGDDCVVAQKAVLTGKKFPPQSVVAGNPAEVKKRGVSWDQSRKVAFSPLVTVEK